MGAVRGNNSYGCTRWAGHQESTHRVSWMQNRGAIPEGMRVLHRCDIPTCVNPDHLFLGTQQDNVDDMMRKGRKNGAKISRSISAQRLRGIGRGENSINAKLTKAAVISIAASKDRARDIAVAYGVSIHTVNDLRRRRPRNWRHVNMGS